MENEYVAHVIRDANGKIVDKQTVQHHSQETAKRAAEFAIEPLKNLAYNTALYHDVGKYQASFQKKILEDEEIKVAHAMAGAQVIRADFGDVNLVQLMEYVISGHHAGMPDFGNIAGMSDESTLCGYLQRSTEDFSAYKSELAPRNFDWQEFFGFMLSKGMGHQEVGELFAFLTRYIFSCVTDADSLDTHYFCTKEKTEPLVSNFQNCLKKLNAHIEKFHVETPLQKARGRLQQQVYEKIKSDADIFLMNMPTGSGKTICSLKFALERAIEFHKKRIIYVIPYNSIIDQTAEIIENIFGDDVQLLRHQSTFVYDKTSEVKETDDKNDDVDYAKNAHKACENWDGDFIITTAVQFFESIHGNRRNKLRKFHNMADSIIIFDEAHLMPENFLIPCLRSITNIVQCLNSEAVFLTATMPNYEDLLAGYCNVKISNLVEDTSDFKAFEKAEISYKKFEDKEALLADLMEANSKLIVCNSRKTAREIYELATGEKYHLSTYMTALDRQNTIAKIKERLKMLEAEFTEGNVPEERKITVVSTSLIEAGVDLDFQEVYRELAGLDNVLQAGGRCNREGRRKNGKIVVFELEGKPYNGKKQFFAKEVLVKKHDVQTMINEYYKKVYYDNTEIRDNIPTISEKHPLDYDFRSYAQKFKIIEDSFISIVVPQDEVAQKLVEEMKYAKPKHRQLQKYMCNVDRKMFEELLQQGVMDDYGTGLWVLENLNNYSKETGIQIANSDYYDNCKL